MKEEFLTVKEFAAAAGVSTQYIYKILSSSLKPYVKKRNKKTVIAAFAVEFVKEGFPEAQQNQPDTTNQMQPVQSEALQQNSTECNQPDATKTNQNQPDATGEIEALKMLIAELKQDKEDLKRDKEDLKQEALKWQQLLLEERNKVKLLEAAAGADPEPEPAAYTVVEEDPEIPGSFLGKIKWIFKKK